MMDVVRPDGTLYTPPQIQKAFASIKRDAEDKGEGIGLSTLTSENRTTWYHVSYSHSCILRLPLPDTQTHPGRTVLPWPSVEINYLFVTAWTTKVLTQMTDCVSRAVIWPSWEIFISFLCVSRHLLFVQYFRLNYQCFISLLAAQHTSKLVRRINYSFPNFRVVLPMSMGTQLHFLSS